MRRLPRWVSRYFDPVTVCAPPRKVSVSDVPMLQHPAFGEISWQARAHRCERPACPGRLHIQERGNTGQQYVPATGTVTVISTPDRVSTSNEAFWLSVVTSPW